MRYACSAVLALTLMDIQRPIMKVDSVIVLGPAHELYPLVDSGTPKFALPFMSVPLLNCTLTYLAPVSSRIFIICLEQYREIVLDLTQSCTLPIEIICNRAYEGMGYCFNLLRCRIRTSIFILCRGDMHYAEPLRPMLESFAESQDDIHASAYRVARNCPMMCISNSGLLLSYNTDEIPFMRQEKMTVTIEYRLKNFYICQSEIICRVPIDAFGFKNNIIPFLIADDAKIRLIDNKNHQIITLDDYTKQLEFKNNFLMSARSCIIENDFVYDKSTSISDSIIGFPCTVGSRSTLCKCIVMNSVVIGNNCVLESCIIGNGATIPDCTRLKNCRVGHGYILEKAVTAEDQSFSN